MNTVSKILLCAVVIAVLACLWYLLSQKNSGKSCGCGGCTGDCSKCSANEQKDKSE